MNLYYKDNGKYTLVSDSASEDNVFMLIVKYLYEISSKHNPYCMQTHSNEFGDKCYDIGNVANAFILTKREI